MNSKQMSLQPVQQIVYQRPRQRYRSAIVVGKGAKGVLVVIVQKYSGDLAKGILHALQLVARFRAHQPDRAIIDSIPHDRTVLGDPSCEAVGPAVLFDLWERTGRV